MLNLLQTVVFLGSHTGIIKIFEMPQTQKYFKYIKCVFFGPQYVRYVYHRARKIDTSDV